MEAFDFTTLFWFLKAYAFEKENKRKKKRKKRTKKKKRKKKTKENLSRRVASDGDDVSICTFLFAILPVWIFTFVELSFGYKVMFTFVGAIGVFIALSGKSMRLHK